MSFTEARKSQLKRQMLAAYRRHGTVRSACQAVGVPHQTLQIWLASDPAFKADWDEGVEWVTDELERTALQRALDGDPQMLKLMLNWRRPDRLGPQQEQQPVQQVITVRLEEAAPVQHTQVEVYEGTAKLLPEGPDGTV